MSDQFNLFAPLESPAPIAEVRRPRMFADSDPTLRLCVLGSGSGGNSTAVQFDERTMLLDAGFGPRTTQRRLKQAGLDLDAVEAICLTHLDQDHFRHTWPRTLMERRIRLFVHRWHVDEALRLPGMSAEMLETFDDALEPLPGLVGTTTRLQHDRQGTIGYRFEAEASRGVRSFGYATDLGHVPPALIELLRGVSVLCIECNYDEHMTTHSARPSWVNRRNMSDSGHLSNEQSFEAVCQIEAGSPDGMPRHVLLMHQSQQCNHPRKVQRVFERVPTLAKRIILTEQRRRTRWFEAPALPAGRRAQYALRAAKHC